MIFDCPRCSGSVDEEYFGPCDTCRIDLRATIRADARDVDLAEYEPKMNVTPQRRCPQRRLTPFVICLGTRVRGIVPRSLALAQPEGIFAFSSIQLWTFGWSVPRPITPAIAIEMPTMKKLLKNTATSTPATIMPMPDTASAN